MAKFVVKYRLDADGLSVKDLIAERDFLAQRLGIPDHLLQVLSWEEGSLVVTYWMVRDLLPLAELALCREDVREELIEHGVEEVYLGSHPSEHPDLVSSRGGPLPCSALHDYPPPLYCRWTSLCRLSIVRGAECFLFSEVIYVFVISSVLHIVKCKTHLPLLPIHTIVHVSPCTCSAETCHCDRLRCTPSGPGSDPSDL